MAPWRGAGALLPKGTASWTGFIPGHSFVFFFFSSRRRHTRFSRDWSSDVCSSDLLRAAGWDVASAIRHHHERWDGTGFPDGLAGEDIPLGARLIAVADAIDRMSIEDVEEQAGTAFDPEIARLAVQVLR